MNFGVQYPCPFPQVQPCQCLSPTACTYALKKGYVRWVAEGVIQHMIHVALSMMLAMGGCNQVPMGLSEEHEQSVQAAASGV